MRDKILEFFQEDNGGLSMTRLVTFVLVFGAITTWIAVSLYHWTIAEFPESPVALGLGAKLIQKQQESKAPVVQTT